MFLPRNKNLIYTAIKDIGFSRHDFTFEESQEIKLTHKASGFYFRIGTIQVIIDTQGTKAPRLAVYSTPRVYNAIVIPDEEAAYPVKEWSATIVALTGWLGWVKAELYEPDLWADMEHTPHMFEPEEPFSDDRFTPAEIKQLEGRLEEVQQRILALNLPPEAEAVITQAVSEVPAKAKRFTKKELADVIVGALVKEGFKWGLTSEHLAGVWHACQHFFTLLISSSS